jgi:hypothetical protein
MAITQEQIVQEIMEILDETFEHHHGIYLDRGTSLLETLAGITHEQASRPIGAGCAALAAQVAHITFYMEVLERYIVAGDTSKADWGEVWRTVSVVTAEEWDVLRSDLERTYRRVAGALRDTATWASDPHLAGALAITVHSASHLGEIRQALCTLR